MSFNKGGGYKRGMFLISEKGVMWGPNLSLILSWKGRRSFLKGMFIRSSSVHLIRLGTDGRRCS